MSKGFFVYERTSWHINMFRYMLRHVCAHPSSPVASRRWAAAAIVYVFISRLVSICFACVYVYVSVHVYVVFITCLIFCFCAVLSWGQSPLGNCRPIRKSTPRFTAAASPCVYIYIYIYDNHMCQ